METAKSVFVTIAGLVIVVAIVIGGYLLGWWLKGDAINREGEIRRDSFEVQETARDEILRQSVLIEQIEVDIANPEISDAQLKALTGQRKAAEVQLCNVASDITGSVTPAVDRVITRYCG